MQDVNRKNVSSDSSALSRINATGRMNGLSYSKMMHGLKFDSIDINRKTVANLSKRWSRDLQRIAEIAKKAVA